MTSSTSDTQHDTAHQIHILQWNINGLPHNWHELKQALLELDASILCLQESKLKPTDPYNFNIYSYSLYRKDHSYPPSNPGVRRCGVCTYIKNDIPHRQLSFTSQFDILPIEITTSTTSITIVNFYRPPHENITTFLSSLTSLLNTITTPVLLCGDINAHHPLWEKHCRERHTEGRVVHTFLNNQNMIILNNGTHTLPAKQLTHRNTTPDITATSPSLAPSCSWTTSDDSFFSDHLPIHITIGQHIAPLSSFPRWNLKHADWHSFTSYIEARMHPDITINQFTEIMLDAATQHIPQTRTFHNKPRAAPWWNDECRNMVKYRNTLKNRFHKHKTQDTLLLYKKAKAECRKVIKKAKRESWADFISTFNRYTPLSHLWKIFKAFKGRRTTTQKALSITIADKHITHPQEIVDTLANQYSDISSQLPNPIPSLLSHTEDSANSLDYNKPFTLSELQFAIQSTGNTSTGPDHIHYSFFKHLGPHALQTLLNSLNTVFSLHTYPNTWFHAHIIPIPKPNKDHTQADNYRPISLTSCMHKIFERIIKSRLLYYMQSHNILSLNQSGFLPARSTIDNLTHLTADIKLAFARKQYTAAVFLDLKHAYDTLNISTLLNHLHKIHIQGHLLHYLDHYLCHRTFQVRHNGHLSDTKFPSSGLMQGSVLSPLLFVLGLDSALHSIPPPAKIAIYADDIAIWTSHKHYNNALAILQTTLEHIEHKLHPLNLHFSPSKSHCIIFGRGLRPIPTDLCTPLTLHQANIPFSAEAKFLGVTFDQRLTFKPHILHLKEKVVKRMNFLRALTATDFGGDQKTLTLLYTSTIRPIMEYSSLIFENAPPTYLKILDTLENQCLRHITSAFRTSPTTALHIYTNIHHLRDRRTESLFRYFFKIQQIPNHPCIPAITQNSHPRFANAPRHKITLGQRLTTHTGILILPLLKPDPIQKPLPWWDTPIPHVTFLIDKPKSTYTDTEIQHLFHEYRHTHHHNHYIFTDGSKNTTTHRTGAAAVLQTPLHFETILRTRLPNYTSIFSAELYAIYASLQIIQERDLHIPLIVSDSKSALTAINPQNRPQHPTILKIFDILKTLSPTQTPQFLWIPSHCQIPGNEKADLEAKKATKHNKYFTINPTKEEYFKMIREHISAKHQIEWNHTTTQLQEIHPQIESWSTSNQNSRKNEKILTRLRIGHTHLTHSYILRHSARPTCPTCSNSPLTTQHFLIDCPKYETDRLPIKLYCQNHQLRLNLKTLLGNDHPELISLLFQFLSITKLDNQI